MPLAIACPKCRTALRVRDEFAGKRMKCPRCATILEIPANESAMPESSALRAPSGKTKPCPHCGKRVLLTAKKCRFCNTPLEEKEKPKEKVKDKKPEKEETEEKEQGKEKPQKLGQFKPCPRCGARRSQMVKWTAWGSFYGPKLFTHVRCPKCGYGYNGKSGRSNLIPAIVFVTVPILGILALIFWALSVINERQQMGWW